MEKSNNDCCWKENKYGSWYTDCGHIFEIANGTPTENSMKYCPYCGGELQEKGFGDGDDEKS